MEHRRRQVDTPRLSIPGTGPAVLTSGWVQACPLRARKQGHSRRFTVIYGATGSGPGLRSRRSADRGHLLCKQGVEALTAAGVWHPAEMAALRNVAPEALWPAAFLHATCQGSRLVGIGMPETRYARSGMS